MKIATKNIEQREPDSTRTALDCKQYTTLELMINLIRSDRYKDQVQFIRANPKETSKPIKMALPAFFAVDFDGHSASNNKVDNNTGVFIYDIDIYDLPDEKIEQICSIPQTVFCFRSPSNGIKFGVQTNYTGADNTEHKAAYKALGKALERKLGADIETDGQTCNLNRMCFLSHDENAYFNAQATSLNVDKFVNAAQQESKQKLEQAKTYQASQYNRTSYQQAIAQTKIQNFLNVVGTGNRDKPIFVLAIELFKCGYEKNEVLFELNKHSYLMAEHKYQLEHKIDCAHQTWIAGGCETYKPAKRNRLQDVI